MNERNFHEVASVLRDACDKETQQRNVLLGIFSVIESDAFEMLPQFLCEDVELHIYGMPVFAGSWRGYRAVTAAVAANFDKVDGQRPRVESMVQKGDNIAVRLHETGVLKATGEGYEVRGVLWFTFEDTHVRRIDEFLGVVALSPQAASVVVS